MRNTIIPWAPYAERETIVSRGRRSLVSAFSDLVASQQGFPGRELPEIFAAPEDNGENDACRHLVMLEAISLTTQFLFGNIATFARPLSGGEVVAIDAALWEIDDPLPRFAVSAFSLEHWADSEAPVTHRILVDATEFDMWLVQLNPPDVLDDAELEAITDPRLRAARSLAAKGRSERRQRRQVEAQENRQPKPTASNPSSEGLLKMRDICKLTKLGRSTIYRLIDDQSFPEPKRIGRSVRWQADVINQWIAAQVDVSESRD